MAGEHNLKTASREGGEAWKTSKESGDIAHLTSPFSDPTLTRWGQRFLKGGRMIRARGRAIALIL